MQILCPICKRRVKVHTKRNRDMTTLKGIQKVNYCRYRCIFCKNDKGKDYTFLTNKHKSKYDIDVINLACKIARDISPDDASIRLYRDYKIDIPVSTIREWLKK